MTSHRDDTAADLASTPDLAAMRAKLLSDFANGLVGRRHNSFQHRSPRLVSKS
jgi:hypothetical protein